MMSDQSVTTGIGNGQVPSPDFVEAGSSKRWSVLLATSLTYFYDSYDLVILAIAMPVLIKVLGISMAQGGLLASVTMVGAALGSIIIGMIAENRGRRYSLILSMIWFGVGTGFVYCINSWESWMALRFITGVAIGGVFGPCVALITVHWAPKYRARATAFMLSTFAIGAVVASFVGRFSLSYDFRILFATGASSAIVALAFWYLIPADNDQRFIEKTSDAKPVAEKVAFKEIFSGESGKRTILGTVLQCCSLGGFWGAITWIPTFLTKERGLSLETMANFSFLMYTGMFIGYQFFGYLGDKIGRKKALACSFLTDVVAIPVYLMIENGMFLFWWGLLVGMGFGGLFGVTGAFFAELFPQRIRALAGGFCYNVGRFGAIIAPFTVGVIGQTYGLRVGLLVACGVFLIGVLILSMLPETFRSKEA